MKKHKTGYAGMLNSVKGGVTFYECLQLCASNEKLVTQFDRLNSTNLSLKGSQLDLLIDKTTGRLDAEISLFIDFVWDAVFLRLA